MGIDWIREWPEPWSENESCDGGRRRSGRWTDRQGHPTQATPRGRSLAGKDHIDSTEQPTNRGFLVNDKTMDGKLSSSLISVREDHSNDLWLKLSGGWLLPQSHSSFSLQLALGSIVNDFIDIDTESDTAGGSPCSQHYWSSYERAMECPSYAAYSLQSYP